MGDTPSSLPLGSHTSQNPQRGSFTLGKNGAIRWDPPASFQGLVYPFTADDPVNGNDCIVLHAAVASLLDPDSCKLWYWFQADGVHEVRWAAVGLYNL
ncbi:hypothetical protein XELAEV_18036776mg [Xenopus laevis]|uniref:Uncharacterized protein n=1 Tax=Xenopus laevis TaxID=8355 RepID=A0A974CBB1_XENLA|nr:hypothetical protein XELAEV_18036776mg [Xenopus laevis]